MENTYTGTIRINVSIPYGQSRLLPIINKFQEIYSNINFEIEFDDSYIDLDSSGVDLAISVGRPREDASVHRLSALDLIVCGSRTYLNRIQIPFETYTINKHQWILYRIRSNRKLMPIVISEKNGSITEYNPKPKIVVDHAESLANLCSHGSGLTQIPHILARERLEEGRILPLHVTRSPTMGVYASCSQNKKMPEKVLALIDFIQQEMEAVGEFPNRTWASDLTIYRQ